LESEGSKDWDERSLFLTATEVYGLDKGRLDEYLANSRKHDTKSIKDIHKLLADRNTLIKMSNEIQKQLVSGDFDLAGLQTISSSRTTGPSDLIPASELLAQGTPEPPGGPKLTFLPKFSEAFNGLHGMLIAAGLPAIGKSTLGFQIASWLAFKGIMKSLYYDFENTQRILLYRLVENFGLERAKVAGQHLFIRESLRSLNRDLAGIPPPALIVIDSIQHVGTGNSDRREGLGAWIRRFEELKQGGYTVILVSEINRASYTGIPRLDAFKETGDLEYAADGAIVLTEGEGGFIKNWVVKNRHYPTKGQIAMLDRTKPFWFEEVEDTFGGFGGSNELDG
jgi:hypothetical protein